MGLWDFLSIIDGKQAGMPKSSETPKSSEDFNSRVPSHISPPSSPTIGETATGLNSSLTAVVSSSPIEMDQDDSREVEIDFAARSLVETPEPRESSKEKEHSLTNPTETEKANAENVKPRFVFLAQQKRFQR